MTEEQKRKHREYLKKWRENNKERMRAYARNRNRYHPSPSQIMNRVKLVEKHIDNILTRMEINEETFDAMYFDDIQLEKYEKIKNETD